MAAGLYLGGSQVKSVYVGATKAKSVYLGATKVWSAVVPVTITASVAATADDGYATSGTLTSSFGAAFKSASVRTGFARFNGVAIPQGATISSAIISVSSFTSNNHGANCVISAAAADDPATPSTASDITSAALTTHTVSWVAASALPSPATSPDISAVLQEIVDRSGWTSGNAVLILFDCPVSDGLTTSVDKAETLTVTYAA